MDASLTGVRALVVGGTGGIGAAIALGFAEAGAELAIAGRSHDRLQAACSRLGSDGFNAAPVVMDLRDEQSVENGVEHATRLLDGLDVVVDSGGISPIYKRAERTEVAEWDEIFRTNARGAFLLARAAAPRLLGQGHGTVIFVTSVYERDGGDHLAAYAASKGAVGQLARSLALEWASRGVRVNCIAPGYVATELTAGLRSSDVHQGRLLDATPMGRFATPDEVAGAALYLASGASSYVTGATLFVDGGWTAR